MWVSLDAKGAFFKSHFNIFQTQCTLKTGQVFNLTAHFIHKISLQGPQLSIMRWSECSGTCMQQLAEQFHSILSFCLFSALFSPAQMASLSLCCVFLFASLFSLSVRAVCRRTQHKHLADCTSGLWQGLATPRDLHYDCTGGDLSAGARCGNANMPWYAA